MPVHTLRAAINKLSHTGAQTRIEQLPRSFDIDIPIVSLRNIELSKCGCQVIDDFASTNRFIQQTLISDTSQLDGRSCNLELLIEESLLTINHRDLLTFLQ